MKNHLSSNMEQIEALLKKSVVCRLGMNHSKHPYVVPMSFGYQDNTLYFHSGASGKKLALLKSNPNVCFEFDTVTDISKADNPCSWNFKYQSVLGTGTVKFIDDTKDKIDALKVIVAQYSDREMDISESRAEATVVFKVAIDTMTFKQNRE